MAGRPALKNPPRHEQILMEIMTAGHAAFRIFFPEVWPQPSHRKNDRGLPLLSHKDPPIAEVLPQTAQEGNIPARIQ
jgi:hypothetical protein